MGQLKRILVTGGAGFVGSSLALHYAQAHENCEIIAFDNLSRRGSELNLPRLAEAGIRFCHGDVRSLADIEAIGPVDLLVECSAEPSVHAGYNGDPQYLVDTNLIGAINCLEFLRRHGGQLIFLSTSRVYPIAALRALPLQEKDTRLIIEPGKKGDGWSEAGIAETFSLEGLRSLYGATKLSAEHLIAEYGAMYNIPAIVNRCGVLAGPWQMGKVDQGFIALWMARHVFGGGLKYMGFGGTGLQVRDLLHVDDLYTLLSLQLEKMADCQGRIFNVGGGHGVSTSLQELTALCEQTTSKKIEIGSEEETRAADIPYYVTDNSAITKVTGWTPSNSVEDIVTDVHKWLIDNKSMLEPIFLS